MYLNTKSVLTIVIIVIFSYHYGSVHIVEGQESWISALETAESRIVSAFEAIQMAENNGADVHQLDVALSDALTLLNEAKISYHLGNIPEAISRAEESSAISSSIETEATSLAATTRESSISNFKLRLVFTTITIAIIAVGLYVAWGIFKPKFKLSVLRAKPEVINDEP